MNEPMNLCRGAKDNVCPDYILDDLFYNKNILVTGGTGSIGSSIVEKLFRYKPNLVRVFSNDENSTFEMRRKYSTNKNIRFLIGDVRDKDRLNFAMSRIDIVYHCAALKHVPLCEYNPFEAIKTNVLGTQNVIESALYNKVCKVGSVAWGGFLPSLQISVAGGVVIE